MSLLRSCEADFGERGFLQRQEALGNYSSGLFKDKKSFSEQEALSVNFRSRFPHISIAHDVLEMDHSAIDPYPPPNTPPLPTPYTPPDSNPSTPKNGLTSLPILVAADGKNPLSNKYPSKEAWRRREGRFPIFYPRAA